MIIFFNLSFFILCLMRGFFLKNEFSLVKTSLKKILKSLNLFLFLFKSQSFSFNFLMKLFNGFKIKVNNIISFKFYVLMISLTLNLSSKFFLLNSFFKKNQQRKVNAQVNVFESKLNTFLKENPVSVRSEFKKDFTTKYFVRYKPSSFVKFFERNTINILFLRKNKIFNKGRYSRNRQLYRTGVYWCIWLSVFLGYGLYFSFYRFTLNFGYQWWLIFLFLFLFINQKMFKYNLYNIKVVFSELKKNFNWVSLFLTNTGLNIKKLI